MARLDIGYAGTAYMAETKPNADDLFELGITFSTGEGVTADLVAAHKWFNLAALRGNDEAAWHRQELALEMTPAEIAQAQRSAREWLTAH